MGLFSSTRIFVSSSIYNLAGDKADRPNYLKTVTVGGVLSPTGKSMTKHLSDFYLNGPGIKLRNFYRWAVTHYTDVGVPGSNHYEVEPIPTTIVQNSLPLADGETAQIRSQEVDVADYHYWAEQYMLANYEHMFNTNWTADIDDTGNDHITITFADGSTETFAPYDFSRDGVYLYVTYFTYPSEKSRIWIYRFGSGSRPALDIYLKNLASESSSYFPIIPVRLDNKMVGDIDQDLYAISKRAYKKAFASDYDDLVAKLEENESLDDIDFAYVAFGVPLNVDEPQAKDYIFEFFDILAIQHQIAQAEYQEWYDNQQQYEGELDAWEQWFGMRDIDPNGEPIIRDIQNPPKGQIIIEPDTQGIYNLGYKNIISWNHLRILTGTGLYETGREAGDIWWEINTAEDHRTKLLDAENDYDVPLSYDRVKLIKQVDANNWRAIDMWGLVHKNYIYQGKYVQTGATEALLDSEDSPFLVPLKLDALTDISLINATQLTTTSAYLMVHSYEVVKVPWYATGFFKLVSFVIVIAISVATGGIGAASAGILGTNAAVGAALGLTGATAVFFGALANMLAAIILTAIVSEASSLVFGDKFGAIIGVIVSTLTINALSNLASTGNFALHFPAFSSAQGLMKLTGAVGNVYSEIIKQNALDVIEQTKELIEEYEEQLEIIEQAYAENIGYGNGYINPMMLVGSQDIIAESSDSFLSRTLLTGSDIAELQHRMLSNFTEISLNTNTSLG